MGGNVPGIRAIRSAEEGGDAGTDSKGDDGEEEERGAREVDDIRLWS
jgi:hypothetical protein